MIRRHMNYHHKKEWSDTVISERLKGWEGLCGRPGLMEQEEADLETFEPFTLAGFIDRLGGCMVDNNLVSLTIILRDRCS